MDTRLTARPGDSFHPSPGRAEPLPVRSAVATELSSSRTVTAAVASEAGPDLQRDPHGAADTTRDVRIDPQTREVIFRVLSARTGKVLRQVPEEAILKLRAYNRAELERDEAARRKRDTIA